VSGSVPTPRRRGHCGVGSSAGGRGSGLALWPGFDLSWAKRRSGPRHSCRREAEAGQCLCSGPQRRRGGGVRSKANRPEAGKGGRKGFAFLFSA